MSDIRITQQASFTRFGVWTVWALMLGLALWFVVQYGSPIFFGDDWAIAPALTGEQPITLSWLWSQHNEHRIPLPRFILLGIYGLTGNDLRAPMFFNVALLGGLSFAMIRVAGTLRGKLHLTDAIFPLILLHLGHAENLIWSWQVGFVLPSVLVGILLLIIVSGTSFRGRPGHGLLAGVCLLLLPLCGANGILWAFPLAIWACIATFPLLRSANGSGRRAGVFVVILLLLTAAVSLFYLVGYERPAHHPLPPSWFGVVKTSLVFLSTLFGMLAGLGSIALSLGAIGALLLLSVGAAPATAVLARHGRTDQAEYRDEWIRAAGILLLLCGPILLALTVGWGRSGLGTSFGFAGRYTTLLAPAFCCVYFAWVLYGQAAPRRTVQTALFALAALLIPIHFVAGTRFGKKHRGPNMVAFQRDLRAGLPPDLLAARHATAVGGGLPPAELENHFRAMHAAGIGEFRRLNIDSRKRRPAQ